MNRMKTYDYDVSLHPQVRNPSHVTESLLPHHRQSIPRQSTYTIDNSLSKMLSHVKHPLGQSGRIPLLSPISDRSRWEVFPVKAIRESTSLSYKNSYLYKNKQEFYCFLYLINPKIWSVFNCSRISNSSFLSLPTTFRSPSFSISCKIIWSSPR